MLDMIQRFFGEFRPADLVASALELTFILVILWLELPARFHKRRIRKRMRMVKNLMLQGQEIQRRAPTGKMVEDEKLDGNALSEIATKWVDSVKEWWENTYKLLDKYSPLAALSFVHHRGGICVQYSAITGLADARDLYRVLLERLDNLLNIMEKSDIYF